jgi:hypothetical protein
MGVTTSHPNEHCAGASIDAVPGAWPTDGVAPYHRAVLHQGSSWIAETFVDNVSAEIDLCADRAGFIKRNDIMDHIPDHIKRRIMHPSPESQIRGFEDLFVYLNTPGAEVLRRLVTTYFSDTLPLCSHLSQSSVRGIMQLEYA